MNFKGTLESGKEKVELKYCERCGGLFLRTPGAGVVYCDGCASRLAGDPNLKAILYSEPRRKSRGARLAGEPKKQLHLRPSGQIEYLQGVEIGEARA
ncbi:MAG: hypothetical protein WA609_12450 [Terriglobales bacterium]